ncbi:hypothetical protein BGZ63DRAFT_366767 [Mariannaea sp. PMI_226]|nr:hypothetical protein BGZ63DRAFT_366767 [Mariannaea sp. PMI_226]
MQGLFDWDDGIARTFWDHCYYRQLARKFFAFISAHLGIAHADSWKSSLGRQALPHFWIIPHYNRHSLFNSLPRTASRSAISRPFISGLYQWRIGSNDMGLCNNKRWLFGGTMYLEGCPSSLIQQDKTDSGTIEVSTRTYVIDFGCPVPFTEIPQIIEEGSEACRRLFFHGDQTGWAHYEAARKFVLTFISSIVTPVLPLHGCHFEAGL